MKYVGISYPTVSSFDISHLPARFRLALFAVEQNTSLEWYENNHGKQFSIQLYALILTVSMQILMSMYALFVL